MGLNILALGAFLEIEFKFELSRSTSFKMAAINNFWIINNEQ